MARAKPRYRAYPTPKVVSSGTVSRPKDARKPLGKVLFGNLRRVKQPL